MIARHTLALMAAQQLRHSLDEFDDRTPHVQWKMDQASLNDMKRCGLLLAHVQNRIVRIFISSDCIRDLLIAAWIGEDGHGYVLDDVQGRMSPTEWARQAVSLNHARPADRIVAERNNGGDLVENTIRQIDPSVSFRSVWASRGKYGRAEPVSAFYEQGCVHHAESFAQLEDQLCSWVPDMDWAAIRSPDRGDALVWALTELMVDGDLGESRALFTSLPMSPLVTASTCDVRHRRECANRHPFTLHAIPANLPVPCTTCQAPSAFVGSPLRAQMPKILSPAAFQYSQLPVSLQSPMIIVKDPTGAAERVHEG